MMIDFWVLPVTASALSKSGRARLEPSLNLPSGEVAAGDSIAEFGFRLT